MPRFRVRSAQQEIELEGTEDYIDKYLGIAKEILQVTPSNQPGADEPNMQASSRSQLSAAEFLRRVKPSGGTEQLVALAKFLNDHRNQQTFTKPDLRLVASEARVKDLGHAYYVRAIEQGLLMNAGADRFSITLSGEDLIQNKLAEDK